MLVDSGATHCIVKQGIFQELPDASTSVVAARGFDGATQSRKVRTCDLEVRCDCCATVLTPFLEWPLEHRYDGILGQPWLRSANPCIDWGRGVLSRGPPPTPATSPPSGDCSPRDASTLSSEPGAELPADQRECNLLSMDDFLIGLRNGDYEEVYRMDMNASVVSKVVPIIIARVLNEFADAMPDELPDGLPPMRPIEAHRGNKPLVNLAIRPESRVHP
ncbi:unnamed protein product [Phytophthora fragariaefolia]|uniref:Unnamed protein product n=1 Tax=Phytophthora fragariaefolia TaxID=1490495 RepID=A0A9W6XVS8_9STRA|nr:unnamed protein product [Phytophthora fragariaefolia]